MTRSESRTPVSTWTTAAGALLPRAAAIAVLSALTQQLYAAPPATRLTPAQIMFPGLLGATTQPLLPDPDPRAAELERHKNLDPRFHDMHERQMASIKSQMGSRPVAEHFTLDRLIHFSLDRGILKAEIVMPPSTSMERIDVAGTHSIWMYGRRRQRIAGGGGMPMVLGLQTVVIRYDTDAQGESPWLSDLVVADDSTTFFLQNEYEITRITQTKASFSISVNAYDQWAQPPKNVLNLQANSMLEFRNTSPREFRHYVLPALLRFSDDAFIVPGPADVYRAFGQITPDPSVEQAVEQILPDLDADDPSDRETASLKLQMLGPRGVLAVLRMDREPLSFEQKYRLREFIQHNQHRAESAEALAHDLSFLIDCLEDADTTVRAAAKTELEKQTHQRLDIDLAQPADRCAAAADSLRARLLGVPAVAAPATQPAAPVAPRS